MLNTALALSRRAERDRVVQQALSGGRGDVPGTTLDALGAAAHQLIDDMEDQQVCVCVWVGGGKGRRGAGVSRRLGHPKRDGSDGKYCWQGAYPANAGGYWVAMRL